MFLVGCRCRHILILTLHPGDPHPHTVHCKYMLGVLANSTGTSNGRSCTEKHFQAKDYHGGSDVTTSQVPHHSTRVLSLQGSVLLTAPIVVLLARGCIVALCTNLL